jgi:5S rRNA maturation endonuclease (ribonuclease M5)
VDAGTVSVTHRTTQEVLENIHIRLDAHGCQPKQIRGDSFTARCPAHDDSDPSLSVSTGDQGVLVHCFAGCTTTSVLNALGIEYADLFYETRKSNGNGVAPEHLASQLAKPHTKPARAGSYITQQERERLNQAEQLVAQLEHERCITKTTLARVGCGLTIDQRIIIPTYDRDGQPAPRAWVALADQRQPGKPKISGPRNAKPDLWPRPETPQYADNTDVLIVEGEPDALVGITHNIQVVGLPGVNTWQHQDAERFARFHHVTILLDDDETGREASRNISRDLRRAGINVTERHHTPGDPTRRDLTDLAREHANLKDAIKELPIIQPDTLYNRALDRVDINHMLDTEPEPREWVWDAYLTRGTLNMIHGAAGLGKSMIGLALAAACTQPLPTELLGHFVQPCRVAIIDAENSEDEIHRRLRMAGITNRDQLDYYRTNLTILGDTDTRELFDEIAKTSRLCILDSQRGLWSGDEREQAEAGRMLRDLARIAEDTGLCLLIIHHDTKGGEYSGSSDISAAITGSRLHLERANKKTDDDETRDERRFTHAKCRIGAEQHPVRFKISIDEQIWLQPVTGPTSEIDNQCARIYRWAREHKDWPNVPVKDIKQAFGFPAGDEERNGWRPVGGHLRNGRWAKPYDKQKTLVIEFIVDEQLPTHVGEKATK